MAWNSYDWDLGNMAEIRTKITKIIFGFSIFSNLIRFERFFGVQKWVMALNSYDLDLKNISKIETKNEQETTILDFFGFYSKTVDTIATNFLVILHPLHLMVSYVVNLI